MQHHVFWHTYMMAWILVSNLPFINMQSQCFLERMSWGMADVIDVEATGYLLEKRSGY